MTLNLRGKSHYIWQAVQNYKNWWWIFFNRIFDIRTMKVRLRDGVVIVGGSESLILDLTDEIFVKKVYTPSFMPINFGDIVVDIGANIGIFSLYAARNGANKIYSIEPLSQNVKLIKNNFKINQIKEPSIFKLAISNKNGGANLYLGDLDSHGSLTKHNNSSKFKKLIKVPVITLEKLLDDNKIKKVDFLKIDCEGGEGDIVESTKNSTWKRVAKIALEYHDGLSILSHQEIVDKLRSNGYRIKVKATGGPFGYVYAWRK